MGKTGTLIGSQLRFAVGRRFAPRLYGWFPRLAPWLALGAAGVEKYSGLLLPAYRFSKGTFTLVGVGAGASGIRWSRFTLLDTAGAAAWTGAWVLAGAGIAAAGAQVDPRWAAYAGLSVLCLGILVTTALGRRLKQVLLPHAQAALAAAAVARQPRPSHDAA